MGKMNKEIKKDKDETRKTLTKLIDAIFFLQGMGREITMKVINQIMNSIGSSCGKQAKTAGPQKWD